MDLKEIGIHDKLRRLINMTMGSSAVNIKTPKGNVPSTELKVG